MPQVSQPSTRTRPAAGTATSVWGSRRAAPATVATYPVGVAHDVVTKVRDLEKKRAAGSAGTAGRSPTVSQWLDHWLTTIAARKVRPSTLEGYESKLRTKIKPALGHHHLDGLQPEQVEASTPNWRPRGCPAGLCCSVTGSCRER
jgi:Phage integrase, N-terminal SAM-like domain